MGRNARRLLKEKKVDIEPQMKAKYVGRIEFIFVIDQRERFTARLEESFGIRAFERAIDSAI